MIHTVTFNPAIDCVMRSRALAEGAVNRAISQEFYFGGKGVNVSFVLANLGRASRALGFVAGWTGEALAQALALAGIQADFVCLAEGQTRVNMKLIDEAAAGSLAGTGDSTATGTPANPAAPASAAPAREVETAVNAPGPACGPDDVAAFMRTLSAVAASDVVVLSGGVLPGMPADVYARVMDELAPVGCRMVVDATGEVLLNALPRRPFLVKPNDEEVAEIYGCDPLDAAALAECARDLQNRGAQNVLVSRGGRGSLLLDGTGALHQAAAVPGTLVNSVGAGDSTVAGFVEGVLRAEQAGATQAEAYALAYRLAQACGAATAFSPWLAPADLVEKLYVQLEGQGKEDL